MPVLIIGGSPKDEESATKMPASKKKFMGIGGKYASESDGEESPPAAEENADLDNAQLFLDSIKAGNARRTLEALRTLVNGIRETDTEE
jgi:hypothetical protein